MRTKIELIKGDITKISVDTIVNAANSSLMGGGGVDGAIHRAGGPAILEECKKIVEKQGRLDVGKAVITTAGNLDAKFVIHTVGPVWHGGQKNEPEKLANCYRNSMQLAVDNDCKSVAFPCISTGVYGYPPEEAAKVAVAAVKSFLSKSDDLEKVLFVCFDDENYKAIKTQLEA